VEDAIAFVRREMASGRAFAPGFGLSVRILAKRTPCARQTAMLALQQLREAGVIALEGGGAYRVRDPEVVRTSRAEELDQVVASRINERSRPRFCSAVLTRGRPRARVTSSRSIQATLRKEHTKQAI
jgi:DNA-binding transcriptional regulator YhcF (GntR family)